MESCHASGQIMGLAVLHQSCFWQAAKQKLQYSVVFDYFEIWFFKIVFWIWKTNPISSNAERCSDLPGFCSPSILNKNKKTVSDTNFFPPSVATFLHHSGLTVCLRVLNGCLYVLRLKIEWVLASIEPGNSKPKRARKTSENKHRSTVAIKG